MDEFLKNTSISKLVAMLVCALDVADGERLANYKPTKIAPNQRHDNSRSTSNYLANKAGDSALANQSLSGTPI